MHRAGLRWVDAFRLGMRVLGLAALVPSVLLAIRAPTYQLWMVRVGMIEWGHSVALALLALPLAPALRRAWGWVIWPLTLIASLVYLSPLARAVALAQTLPGRLRQAFGPLPERARRRRITRRRPIVVTDLMHSLVRARAMPQRLPYACIDDIDLAFDFYPAAPGSVAGPAPLVIVIHGGAWEGGDSAQLPDLNHYLAERGYAVAALNYRLAPHHPYPAAYQDVAAAIACVKSQAAALGIDASQIVLLGRSSGGHLALLAAYRDHDPAIRGVIALYPPTDLKRCYDYPRTNHILDAWGVMERFLGGTPDDVPDQYREASPVHYVGSRTPPTLLVHGELDEIVSVENSQWLAERLAAAARPHLFLRLPWATHGCDANLSSPSGQLIVYAVEHFLASVLP